MLSENHPLSRRLLARAAVLLVGCSALWSSAMGADAASQAAGVAESLRGTGPVLTELTDEQREQAQETAAKLSKDILQAYERAVSAPETQREGAQARKYADSIADAALQAERDKVLEFLGIDPQRESGLYIFVSWSMPLPLLRAYVLDAMWSGATLVFKGVPEGKSLTDFITKDLQGLVYGKSAAANISIDPRLFDAYQVKVVPSIVLTKVRANISCQGAEPVEFKSGESTLSYDTCPALSADDYIKVSGNVTTSFALERFKEKDPYGPADVYLRAIAKGFAQGVPPGREQAGFQGRWESVLSPEEAERVRGVVKDIGSRLPEINIDSTVPNTSIQGSK